MVVTQRLRWGARPPGGEQTEDSFHGRWVMTRNASRLLIAILLVGLAGCDSLSGCDEDTRIFEGLYDGFHDSYRDIIVPAWEERGYDCVSESIRNAFGTRIGTKWTCTGCE